MNEEMKPQSPADEERSVIDALLSEDKPQTTDLEDNGHEGLKDEERVASDGGEGEDTEAEDIGTAQFLLSLGAQPLSTLEPKEPTPPPPESDDDALPDVEGEVKGSNVDVSHLFQVCQRTYGNHDALKWDFGVDGGVGLDKKATLTIQLPNGNKRIFRSRGNWTKKIQAKASAAKVAIESGALDFLRTGRDARVRNPDPTPTEKSSGPAAADAERILEQCKVWRQGKVRPIYTYTVDPKQGTGFGCAISIYLSKQHQKTWSVRIAYPTKADAKLAVCKEAIRLGILDYIVHGDGLRRPWTEEAAATYPKQIKKLILLGGTKDNPGHITQQAWYDALSQKLPPNVGFRDGQTNPITYFYQMFNKVKHLGVEASFTGVNESEVHAGHGCLLRIEHSEQSFSYLAPTAFPKRTEAKAAVCLLALAQGVSNILQDLQRGKGKSRSLKPNARTPKITPMKSGTALPSNDRELGEVCLQAIMVELRAFRADARPDFNIQHNADGSFTVKLELHTDPRDRRIFADPGRYQTEHDAKLATSIFAVTHGALEFVRFRGAPVPYGYIRPPVGGIDIPYEPDGERRSGVAPIESHFAESPGLEDGPLSSYQSYLPSYRERHNEPSLGDSAHAAIPGNGERTLDPAPNHIPRFPGDDRGYYSYPDTQEYHPSDPFPTGYRSDSSPADAYVTSTRPDYESWNSHPDRSYRKFDPYDRPTDLDERHSYKHRRSPVREAYAGRWGAQQRYSMDAPAALERQYDRAYRADAYSSSYRDSGVADYYGFSSNQASSSASYPPQPSHSPLQWEQGAPVAVSRHYGCGNPGTGFGSSPTAYYEPTRSENDLFRRDHLVTSTGYSRSSMSPQSARTHHPMRSERPPVSDDFGSRARVLHSSDWADAGSRMSSSSRPVQGSSQTPYLSSPLDDVVHLPAASAPMERLGVRSKAEHYSGPATGEEANRGNHRKSLRKRPHSEVNMPGRSAPAVHPKRATHILLEFCKSHDLGEPSYFSESVPTESGMKHRVWLTLGQQRMQLKSTFDTVEQGYERLSTVVLEQLKKEHPEAKRRKIDSEGGKPPSAFPAVF